MPLFHGNLPIKQGKYAQICPFLRDLQVITLDLEYFLVELKDFLVEPLIFFNLRAELQISRGNAYYQGKCFRI